MEKQEYNPEIYTGVYKGPNYHQELNPDWVLLPVLVQEAHPVTQAHLPVLEQFKWVQIMF